MKVIIFYPVAKLHCLLGIWVDRIIGFSRLAIKLLIDAGIIKNKNATELMKLVARNFKTDNREQISFRRIASGIKLTILMGLQLTG